jgi:hypothetical protein
MWAPTVGQRGVRLSERQPAAPLPSLHNSVQGCRPAHVFARAEHLPRIGGRGYSVRRNDRPCLSPTRRRTCISSGRGDHMIGRPWLVARPNGKQISYSGDVGAMPTLDFLVHPLRTIIELGF